ncbi:unnamed protein product, partial [Didymodactylos carnosus]
MTLFNDNYYTDLQYVGSSPFQALALLCQLSEQTVNVEIERFGLTDLITPNVMSHQLFLMQINTFIHNFKQNTPSQFMQTLELIQIMTYGNQLLPAMSINSLTTLEDIGNHHFHMPPTFMNFSNCSCITSSDCIEEMYLANMTHDSLYNPLIANITHFYTGCYVVNALMQSTLECFFNLTCFIPLFSMLSDMKAPHPLDLVNVTVLDSTIKSQYEPNTLIDVIFKNLTIEEWKNETNFGSYYGQCAPSFCSYSVATRNNLIYIITKIIGLIGGLMTGLKFLVPFSVLVIRKIIDKIQKPLPIENDAIPQNTFNIELDSIINSYQSQTPIPFLTAFYLMRGMTQANQLMSSYQTNYKFDLNYNFFDLPDNLLGSMLTTSVLYGEDECDCAQTSTCIQPLNMFKNFYTGCYPIEALLKSTLECFYDKTCVRESSSVNLTVSQQYSPNTTIAKILDGFMIEQWNNKSNYSAFYDNCHPQTCTYTETKRYDIPYIVTTTIGVIGGLTTIIKMVLPTVLTTEAISGTVSEHPAVSSMPVIAVTSMPVTTGPIIYLLTTSRDPIQALCNTTSGTNSHSAYAGYDICQYPPDEAAANAIDLDVSTKYLNFGNVNYATLSYSPAINTGFCIKPTINDGQGTIVRQVQFVTADDHPIRDPLTITLEGTNSASLT